jgi:hypothetical protein
LDPTFVVATPIGVPAGPLLNARWIEVAAKLGFDVLTYKTIRSVEFSGHPVPNMIYVDIKEGEEDILAQKKEKIVFSTDVVPQVCDSLYLQQQGDEKSCRH